MPDEYLDPIHNASINAQTEFTSDGKLVVTGTSGDGYVIGQPALVWDVQTGKLLQALKHEGASIWDVAITSDDRYVVTASYDNSVALWDIRTGERIQTFPGHPMRVIKAIVNSNGRLLATASADGSLRILLTRSKTGGVSVWPLPPLGKPLIDLAWERIGKSRQELLTQEQRIRFGIEED